MTVTRKGDHSIYAYNQSDFVTPTHAHMHIQNAELGYIS